MCARPGRTVLPLLAIRRAILGPGREQRREQREQRLVDLLSRDEFRQIGHAHSLLKIICWNPETLGSHCR